MIAIKDISNSKKYLISDFLSVISPLILYPIITKKLEPSVFGNYIMFCSIVMMITGLSNMGCLLGFRRNLVKYINTNFFNNYIFSIQFFIFCVFTFIFFVCLFLDNYLFNKISQIDDQKSYWSILVLIFFIDFFNKYFFSYLVVLKKSLIYLYIFALKSFSNIFLTIIFFKINLGLFSILYSLLIVNTSIAIISILYQFKYLKKAKFKFFLVKETLKISYPMTFRILFGKVNGQFDKIFIANILGPSATAIYYIGQSISYFVFLILNSLEKVFITEMNSTFFKKDRLCHKRYFTPFFFILGLSAIALILFNDLIFLVLIDNNYSGSIYVILIFCVFNFLQFFGKISGSQLILARKTWWINHIFILNMFLNLLLTIFLVKKIGMEGAAVATLISGLITLYLGHYIANKFIVIKFETEKLLFIFFFVVLTVIYVWYLNLHDNNLSVLNKTVKKIVILFLYFIVGFKMKIINTKTLRSFFKF